MNTKDLVKLLKALGFVEIGGKKHIKYKQPDGRWTSISKGSHEISRDLLKKIEQQIGESLK
ncbi:MAG: type II toxin-antitoxin system HicA family toxin [Lachnospiraceae bacterium]|nr:type II toxin-antitoxin system HicA family toxin [Lachnospiraceae bacterium]